MSHLQWLLNAYESGRPITMPSFVKQFGYSCREDAHEAFVVLLSSTDIPLRARESLQQKYDIWQRNSGKEYWSSVSASLQIKISTNRTAEQLSVGGEYVVNNFVKGQIAGDINGPMLPDYVAFGQKLSHDLFENEEAGLPKIPTRKRSSHSLHPSSTPTILKRGRSTRVTPSKIARRTSSKTRIEEPWHSLIEAALVLHDGWQVDLPEVDTPYEDGSPSRSKLYQLALQHLHNATALQVQTHFDRVHCLDFKDALVSLSGIWNLYSSAANNMFGITATAEAKAFCHMQSMDNKDDVLVDIAGVLLGKKTLEEILDETYHLQVAQPKYRRMLDVLQIIIRNIIRPLHGLKKEPSEADCLAVWSSIFQEGLPLNSLFSMNLGEQGCFASALSKSKLADVFETGTTARKCDGLLSVNLVEVGNLEFKRVGASKLEVACQLRKNIKINKSILLELDKYGLECPLLLSVHGMSAIVFRVRKWQDIWVAGKASSTIVLPSTFDELRLFLGDPVHQLAKLLDHYHEYAAQADQLFQEYQYRKKGEDEEDAVSAAPKSVTETLDWEQVVFHTPTKVAKRPSLLNRLKHAKEEANQVWSEEEVETLVSED